MRTRSSLEELVKVVVVGGVAGGMSAAARLRRLDANAEIVVLERGNHVSYANCGLPYHLSGTIAERADLLLHTPESLRDRFALDVRLRHEAVAIDPGEQVVTVADLAAGTSYRERYDYVVLAPGAAPVVPAIPGAERAFTLRSVEDLDRIVAALDDHEGPMSAVVVGGGFIGLEAADNLAMRGLAVTVVEFAPQLLAPLDPELAPLVAAELERNGVAVALESQVVEVDEGKVLLSDGTAVAADLVLFAIGVRPDVALAKAAGLRLGARGGIEVDAQQRTSDSRIFAVGDAVEKADAVDGAGTLVPLANLANRHGRRAADAIAGRATDVGSSQGTAIVRVFGLTIGVTGWNEKRALAARRQVGVVHTHPGQHAGYFPGAEPLALKVVYDPDDGRLLGAQAIGRDGVDKRIDVLATAISAGLAVEQLADLELAYAPPFGSAKDPVNQLGYVAENRRTGLSRAVQWHEVEQFVGDGHRLVDVRTPQEYAAGRLPGAVNIPVDELRARHAELPDAPLIVYCAVGQRAHVAEQLLRSLGHDVVNLDGGWSTWSTSPAGAAHLS
jgi:NADPH-dependent 2,4-dienoyl-CoA reductase/sulfur reductase-like enzyme/rhodanese-related sulfurtransferase